MDLLHAWPASMSDRPRVVTVLPPLDKCRSRGVARRDGSPVREQLSTARLFERRLLGGPASISAGALARRGELVNRRAGILAFAGGLLAASHAIHAATSSKTYRIGVLCPSWEDLGFFVRALQAVGYEEGRNAELVFKRGDGQAQLDALAKELAATKVDVIAASSTIEIQAAKRATSKIPIVMMYGVAPVELGLIASLARPGGNVTGTVAMPLEL